MNALLRKGSGLCWLVAVYAFLLAPLVVVIGASFSSGDRTYIEFPPTSLTLHWYGEIPETIIRSLTVSLSLALATSLAATLIGVPAALGLVRSPVPGKKTIAALFRAPLQIPAVVIGVSFLQLYYVLADALRLSIVDSFLGLWIAHLFMATPYVIGPIVAVLQRFNMRLEEAALIHGASRWSTLRRITLPVIMPGIYVGALYAFMISFADLPVSMMLAGTGYRPFPVELFQAMDYDFNPALLAVSTIIIAFSIVAMLAVQRLVGLQALLRAGGGG